MSHMPQLVKFAKVGIDGKTTGSTLIGTTDDGVSRFIPLFAVLACTVATAITIVPVASIGTNSASYNNIVAATTLTAVSVANVFLKTDVAVATTSIAPNTGIYVNISVGATATTMTLSVHVFGYYL